MFFPTQLLTLEEKEEEKEEEEEEEKKKKKEEEEKGKVSKVYIVILKSPLTMGNGDTS